MSGEIEKRNGLINWISDGYWMACYQVGEGLVAKLVARLLATATIPDILEN
jgi:hypothetical protein